MGKTAGSAHIVVGNNGHSPAAKGLRVQGSAVVNDIHVEMTGYIIIRINNILFYQVHIIDDETFFLKSGRSQGKLNISERTLIIQGIIAVADGYPTLGTDGKTNNNHVFGDRQRNVHNLPVIRCSKVNFNLVKGKRMSGKGISICLLDGSSGSFEFQVKSEA